MVGYLCIFPFQSLKGKNIHYFNVNIITSYVSCSSSNGSSQDIRSVSDVKLILINAH